MHFFTSAFLLVFSLFIQTTTCLNVHFNLTLLQSHYPPSFWTSIPLRKIPEFLKPYIISPEDVEMNHYEHVIGKGMQGKCYLGTLLNHQVVGKIVYSERKCYYALLYEARRMAQMNHPNILSLAAITWVPSPPAKRPNQLMVLTPYMENGQLRQYRNELELHNRKIPTLQWLEQILNGIEYMHSFGYAHYDISGHNIYIDHDENAVIGDFGLLLKLSRTIKEFGQPLIKDLFKFSKMLEQDVLWNHPIPWIEEQLHTLRNNCATIEQIRTNLLTICNFSYFQTVVKELQDYENNYHIPTPYNPHRHKKYHHFLR